MKKKTLVFICLVALLAVAAAGIFWWTRGSGRKIAIDAENFPDEIFRAYVSDYYDLNDDGVLDKREIRAAKNCAPKEMEVRSLKGIEFLIYLERLNCSSCELESLDVSNNRALKDLDTSYTPLKELKLGNNTKLTYLVCRSTPLTSLDVKGCTKLKTLQCSGFEFKELDISNHPFLEWVNCLGGALESLDAHNCPVLESLYYNGAPLITLDIRDCDRLQSYPEDEGTTILR
ncbi:MAG: hypothetical protein IKX10_05345 [Lachnospiraceae bacterium]|nr:hypothetical protein [Lachnospiraceae bacterium]